MKLIKLPKVTFSPELSVGNMPYHNIYLDGALINVSINIGIIKIGFNCQLFTYPDLKKTFVKVMSEQNVGDPADRNYIASEIIRFIKSILPP